MEKEKSVLESIGGFVVAMPLAVCFVLVIALPMMLMRAFIFRYLWLWFVVPLFGMMPLSYGQAMGIAVVVGFFCNPSPVKKEYKEGAMQQFGTAIALNAFALGVGLDRS